MGTFTTASHIGRHTVLERRSLINSDAWDGLSDNPPRPFLSGGGEMGAAITAFDWSQTSLGPMENWPQSLKTITHMVMMSKQPMCFFWGPELLNFFNDAYRPMLGKRADGALGRPFKELWSDVWEDVLPFTRQALSGEGTWTENLRLRMTRNGYEEDAYFTFSYSPLYDDDGRVAGILDIATETTKAVIDRAELNTANRALAESIEEAQRLLAARIHSEEQQSLLQRELSHRMKNTLSVVQAIVAQTMRHSKSLSDASETIAGRLIALSRAQDTLTENSWANADLRDVIDNALSAHLDRDGRFAISGPPARVTAQQALGMSLAIHELATNAVKYGALSNEHGAVTIGWTLEASGLFCFEWRESGGPRVTPPTVKGFGSRLIETIVASYFSGRGNVAYEPNGINFTLDGRLDPEEQQTVSK